MSATQIDRPFRVKTTLGDDDLLLESFSGVERVSEPFRFLLRLLSPNPNIDMGALLNEPVVLSILLNEDTERHIHGNICRIKMLEQGSDAMTAYEAEVVPWFWFLTQFSNCRIFQNKSVPDIIEKVFRDRGFTEFESRLQASYPPREYCVQYRETDFNFVSRLMEQEGICYFFEQTEEKHTLVLADSPNAFPSCAHQSEARFLPASGGLQDNDTVNTLEAEYRVRPGTSSLTDYNFETPQTSLYSTLAGTQQGELYDYPGNHKNKEDGERYVRIRLEEQEAPTAVIRGESNCLGFECGYKFTLSEHPRDNANTEYTLLSLEHRGKNTSYRSGTPQPYSYFNRFEATEGFIPFRPPRSTRKPVIDGVQTAVVTGKSGEEILVDQYGRIKVQFFWDREGTLDENSSCWIRVAQGWAGKHWGFLCTPRVNQEVVVSFLEGDPDRPLITGSVYNAEQMPPYTLPDNQTKSTWKSMSSKGGAGFNELRFEDNKGKEQIFVHGEKNLDIRIKNDEYKTIENNLHLTVNKDRYEHIKSDHHSTVDKNRLCKVGGDQHLSIDGKQAIQVSGSHSLQVSGNVAEVFSQNHSESVSMSLYLKAGAGIVIEDPTGITLKCGGNSVVIDPTGVTIKGTLVTVDGELTKINSGPGSPAMPGAPGTAISPTAPHDATDADRADPGDMSQMEAQQHEMAKGSYGSIDPATRR